MFLYTYIYMKWVKSCYSFFTSLEKVLILGVSSFFFQFVDIVHVLLLYSCSKFKPWPDQIVCAVNGRENFSVAYFRAP